MDLNMMDVFRISLSFRLLPNRDSIKEGFSLSRYQHLISLVHDCQHVGGLNFLSILADLNAVNGRKIILTYTEFSECKLSLFNVENRL